MNRHPGRCSFELRPPVILITYTAIEASSAVCASSVRLFLLHLFRHTFLTLPRAKPDDSAVERRSISASRNALAINVILKAAMASPPQIAGASCTSSSTELAAVGEGFVRPVLTQRSLMYSADNWEIRAVLRSAIGAFGMQKDQCPKGRTIRPSRSGRQASERPPCCHKESVAAYQQLNLAAWKPVKRQQRKLCVSETSSSSLSIEAQPISLTWRRSYDRDGRHPTSGQQAGAQKNQVERDAKTSHLIRWSIQEIRRIAQRLAQKRIQPADIIAWSLWRRAHQAAAQKSHIKQKSQL
jgi:hypothetical protein